MNDLAYTNASIAAGFTCRNDPLGQFMFYTDVKRIYFREGFWWCDNNETNETSKYLTLKEAIEAEKP